VDKIDPLGLAPNTNSDLSPIYSKTTNYLIPHDNPFVSATTFDDQTIDANSVQTEFWAVGLRDLFCGDVGQDQYEEADIITRGGNYGWAWWEGTNKPPSGVSTAILDATPLPFDAVNPFVTYGHGSGPYVGDAIIGGVVYRGQNLPQLYGDYLFGDYEDGNIWAIPAAQAAALTASNATVNPSAPLFTDNSGISSFGVDPRNGDVLYTSLANSSVRRLIYNATTVGPPLPGTLYATGAFTNLLSLTNAQEALAPAPGIVPYAINVPFWSDNALKSRWFCVPATNSTIGFNPSGNWTFPGGMVWIKNFNLELTNGDPTSQIRLETRFLVMNTNGIYGVTYIWNSPTNAVLAPAAGLNTNYVINNGGVMQTQTWHFPAQTECVICHTGAGGYGMGFRTEQLNCPEQYGAVSTNQIQALSAAGYFNSPVTNNPSTLLALAASTNTAYSLEFRARSFLMANCSQCHQPAGTCAEASWDARITTPTALAGLINGPLVNNLGGTNNYVISPMSAAHSAVLTRDAARDLASNPSIQMPPLDSYVVDSDATNLITEWINSLTNTLWIATAPSLQTVQAGSNAVSSVYYVATPDLNGSATLSVSNLPPGASANFSPPSLNQTTTNATLTITTSRITPGGTYTPTVWARAGSATNSASLTLAVTPTSGEISWGYIGSAVLSGGNLVISGTNGVPNETCYILGTTNLALPLSKWRLVAVKTFAANGGFNFTNLINPASPRTFYTLRLNAPGQPVINAVSLNAGNLILSGANGTAYFPYDVLASTNLALPLSNWTLITESSFDAYGNFSVTNTISPRSPRMFYILRAP
jgi:hypothetical protein